MNFENIFQNLFYSIKTTDKNHNNHNCLSSTPTHPIYPKSFQTLGKTSACEIHPTTESKVLAPLHMRQWVHRLTDPPQVRSGKARTCHKSTPPPKSGAPSPRTPTGQRSHGIHCIFWRLWGPRYAGRQVSVLTPLYSISETTFCVHLCLETRSSRDTSSSSRTSTLTATVPTGCLRPPQQWGCWPSHLHPPEVPTPWGTHKSRMKKKKTINVILGAGFYVLISSEYGLGHKTFWIKVRLFSPSFRTWLSGKWKGSFLNSQELQSILDF